MKVKDLLRRVKRKRECDPVVQGDSDNINPYVEKLCIYKDKIINDDYHEKKWNSLQYRYRKINLYGIQFDSVGESMQRLNRMLQDLKEKKLDGRELHVVLPTFSVGYKGGIFNDNLLEIIGRYLYIIDESNFDFWMYALKNHIHEINLKSFNRYTISQPGFIYAKLGESQINLSELQLLEAQKRAAEMGLSKDYICIHAREENEKYVNYGEEYAAETSVCNCDINSFRKACLYMQQKGIQSVRMGKYENKECLIPKVIDYANYYYDGLMDFYLLQNCKFMVASNSGLPILATFLGRPYVRVNTIGMISGLESTVFLKESMYIPQKFYSIKESRYLNMYEILDISDECHFYASRFQERGIRLIKNTEEEIYDAVVEMNARLDCTWINSQEEIESMNRYWNIVDVWQKRHPYAKERKRYGMPGYSMNMNSICWSYLKNNLYLLEMEE